MPFIYNVYIYRDPYVYYSQMCTITYILIDAMALSPPYSSGFFP